MAYVPGLEMTTLERTRPDFTYLELVPSRDHLKLPALCALKFPGRLSGPRPSRLAP